MYDNCVVAVSFEAFIYAMLSNLWFGGNLEDELRWDIKVYMSEWMNEWNQWMNCTETIQNRPKQMLFSRRIKGIQGEILN